MDSGKGKRQKERRRRSDRKKTGRERKKGNKEIERRDREKERYWEEWGERGRYKEMEGGEERKI